MNTHPLQDFSGSLRIGSLTILHASLLAFVLLPVAASAKCSRIISLDSGTDTLVLQLADLENIIAVRERTQNPAVSLQWEKANQVIGLKREMAEEVYQLHPDLVFFGYWSGRSTREMLEKLGVKVVRLRSPTCWEDVYYNIRYVGELIGEEERAEVMILDIRNRLAEVSRKTEGYGPKRAVCYIGRGSTYGSQSKQNFVLESAGLINISAEKGIEGLGKLSVEELLMERPDLIVFSDYKKDTPTLSRQILDHPAFTKLKEDVKLLDLPSNKINCLDVYLVDCVELLARAAYPEAFLDPETTESRKVSLNTASTN